MKTAVKLWILKLWIRKHVHERCDSHTRPNTFLFRNHHHLARMARTKQTTRRGFSPPRREVRLATMSASAGKFTGCSHGKCDNCRPKKPPKKPEDLSAEISALNKDIGLHPYPGSSRRQDPAMTRYHGAPPRAQAPKKKRRHRRGEKKLARALLKKPEVPAPEPEGVASKIPVPPTEPEAPAARRLSEKTQSEVIDLTDD
jgi:hypothetical protein